MEFPTINPDKEKLYRQIKAWLLRFGERDNDGFYHSTEDWDFYLSFDYDLDGSKNYEQFNLRQGKYVIYNPTEEQLQEVFNELIKTSNEL